MKYAAPVPKSARREGVKYPHRPMRRSSRKNQRRIPWLHRLAWGAALLLGAECVAALLTSPRLRVNEIRIEGNVVARKNDILKRVGSARNAPLVRADLSGLSARVGALPPVARAELSRRWPDVLLVRIVERAPYAAIQAGQGVWWIVDGDGVPFAKRAQPPGELPRLLWKEKAALRAGRPLPTALWATTRACLDWSRERPELSLDCLVLEPGGRFSMRTDAGTPIYLGTEVDLDKKLTTLGRLIDERPAVVSSTDIRYINVLAWDAPAILLNEPGTISPPG